MWHVAKRSSSEVDATPNFQEQKKHSLISTVTASRAAQSRNRWISRAKRYLSLLTASRRTMGTTQVLIQRVPGDIFSGVKRIQWHQNEARDEKLLNLCNTLKNLKCCTTNRRHSTKCSRFTLCCVKFRRVLNAQKKCWLNLRHPNNSIQN